MKPLDYFNEAWGRCEHLTTLHDYLDKRLTSALSLDEMLRAEWVSRVSALDLYIHELVLQNMMDIYYGKRPSTPSYLKFRVSMETLSRMNASSTPTDAGSAFELEIRTSLARVTYQDPDTIADGIRLISTVDLWAQLAIAIKGATAATKIKFSKEIKRDLSLIVSRRNKIAHEGDLQSTSPRLPWAINRDNLNSVATTIKNIVYAIDDII
jgi:RiboL-PSP-HEPN